MDRIQSRRALLFGSLLGMGALASSSGCSIFATALYVLKGTNVEADYNGLKNKKVVVVCRPVTNLEFNNSHVAEVLARQVGMLLDQNVRGIKIVDQRKVSEWTDEHNWEDYTEIGKALNADMVVGIDLEGFDIHGGQALLQGRATAEVTVHEVKESKTPVFAKHLPQVVYPPTGGIAASDKPEAEFRRQFLAILAKQVAQMFYEHDPVVDFAQDSTVLN